LRQGFGWAMGFAGVFMAGPLSAAQENCPKPLQQWINEAAPGATVLLPACIYREAVTINKPLTLDGQGQAEIRGSNIWIGWTKSGAFWTKGPVPDLPTWQDATRCKEGTNNRCLKAEQVFIDGRALTQVPSNPAPGQFALDGARNVLLADDPTGKTVEVTVRQRWVLMQADNVTVRGFTMKHSANDAQRGGIGNDGRSHITIQNNVLSDAHGYVVRFDGDGAMGLKLLGNDISRGGEMGFGGSAGDGNPATIDIEVRNNDIHHNQTEDFECGWECGGMKMAVIKGAIWDGNTVRENNGPGMWCDIDCANITISNNNVYRNRDMGIFFEISDGAKIFGNRVWQNVWNNPAPNSWGYNTGILISSSRNAEVYDNTVAWNDNDQITLISQDRARSGGDNPEWDQVYGHFVHDNRLFGLDSTNANSDKYHSLGLGWLQDFAGTLFDAASNNRGARNLYYYVGAEGTNAFPRFAWDNGYERLADFNATPGEENGRYMTLAEKNAALSAAGIPLTPTGDPAADAAPGSPKNLRRRAP